MPNGTTGTAERVVGGLVAGGTGVTAGAAGATGVAVGTAVAGSVVVGGKVVLDAMGVVIPPLTALGGLGAAGTGAVVGAAAAFGVASIAVPIIGVNLAFGYGVYKLGEAIWEGRGRRQARRQRRRERRRTRRARRRGELGTTTVTTFEDVQPPTPLKPRQYVPTTVAGEPTQTGFPTVPGTSTTTAPPPPPPGWEPGIEEGDLEFCKTVSTASAGAPGQPPKPPGLIKQVPTTTVVIQPTEDEIKQASEIIADMLNGAGPSVVTKAPPSVSEIVINYFKTHDTDIPYIEEQRRTGFYNWEVTAERQLTPPAPPVTSVDATPVIPSQPMDVRYWQDPGAARLLGGAQTSDIKPVPPVEPEPVTYPFTGPEYFEMLQLTEDLLYIGPPGEDVGGEDFPEDFDPIAALRAELEASGSIHPRTTPEAPTTASETVSLAPAPPTVEPKLKQKKKWPTKPLPIPPDELKKAVEETFNSLFIAGEITFTNEKTGEIISPGAPRKTLTPEQKRIKRSIEKSEQLRRIRKLRRLREKQERRRGWSPSRLGVETQPTTADILELKKEIDVKVRPKKARPTKPLPEAPTGVTPQIFRPSRRVPQVYPVTRITFTQPQLTVRGVPLPGPEVQIPYTPVGGEVFPTITPIVGAPLITRETLVPELSEIVEPPVEIVPPVEILPKNYEKLVVKKLEEKEQEEAKQKAELLKIIKKEGKKFVKKRQAREVAREILAEVRGPASTQIDKIEAEKKIKLKKYQKKLDKIVAKRQKQRTKLNRKVRLKAQEEELKKYQKETGKESPGFGSDIEKKMQERVKKKQREELEKFDSETKKKITGNIKTQEEITKEAGKKKLAIVQKEIHKTRYSELREKSPAFFTSVGKELGTALEPFIEDYTAEAGGGVEIVEIREQQESELKRLFKKPVFLEGGKLYEGFKLTVKEGKVTQYIPEGGELLTEGETINEFYNRKKKELKKEGIKFQELEETIEEGPLKKELIENLFKEPTKKKKKIVVDTSKYVPKKKSKKKPPGPPDDDNGDDDKKDKPEDKKPKKDVPEGKKPKKDEPKKDGDGDGDGGEPPDPGTAAYKKWIKRGLLVTGGLTVVGVGTLAAAGILREILKKEAKDDDNGDTDDYPPPPPKPPDPGPWPPDDRPGDPSKPGPGPVVPQRRQQAFSNQFDVANFVASSNERIMQY